MTFIWAVILFGLLIFFHELGHFIVAKLVGVKVLKFSLGFGPKIFGRTVGETEYLLSAIPLGGYVKPLGEEPGEEISEEDKPRAFNNQPVWKRAAIVLAGPIFNLVLAYIIFVVFLSASLPVTIPKLDSITTTIENVMEDSPAMKAGLTRDDTIISIDDESVSEWNVMAEVFSKNPGKALSLKVKRNDELIDMKIIPEPTTVKNEQGEEVEIGRIGISKKFNATVIQSESILSAPFKGVQAVYEWCVLTLNVIVKLFTGSVSAKQLGGPHTDCGCCCKSSSCWHFHLF